MRGAAPCFAAVWFASSSSTTSSVLRRSASHVLVISVSVLSMVMQRLERRPDRRVVDTVAVGNPASEAAHGYVGHDAVVGVSDGKPYRQARGWMRFALTTFDDTEVTVACTFVAAAGEDANVSRTFDVVVEDSVVATRVLGASAATPTVVEIPVPFSITKGRTNVAIMIRAHDGSTPALRELRTIQDHNEFAERAFAFRDLDISLHSLGVTR
jgi:hypothetical protein